MTVTNTVPANLIFFQLPTDGSKPYTTINADPTTGERGINWTKEPHDVEIENLRGKEDSVTLDTAGFQYFKQPQKYTSFADDEEIEREYYPESIALIKELLGASRVVPFDHSTSSDCAFRGNNTEVFRVCSNSPSPTGRDRRQPSEETACSPSSRRSDSCFCNRTGSQAPSCGRCARAREAPFPDHQPLAPYSPRCVGLASRALRLQEHRRQERPGPCYPEVPR